MLAQDKRNAVSLSQSHSSDHNIECDRASNTSSAPNIVLRYSSRFYIAPVENSTSNTLTMV